MTGCTSKFVRLQPPEETFPCGETWISPDHVDWIKVEDTPTTPGTGVLVCRTIDGAIHRTSTALPWSALNAHIEKILLDGTLLVEMGE